MCDAAGFRFAFTISAPVPSLVFIAEKKKKTYKDETDKPGLALESCVVCLLLLVFTLFFYFLFVFFFLNYEWWTNKLKFARFSPFYFGYFN